MFMSSDPSVVICISIVVRVLIVWYMCLLVLLVLYRVMCVNCLLKACFSA